MVLLLILQKCLLNHGLVIGFALLSTSTLTTTRHFGILSSVTMVAAVLADLFLLPALLHLAVGGRRQPAPTS